jgi:hypothetical protein
MTIERAVVQVMNLDGWQLESVTDNKAKGLTPRGKTCSLILRVEKQEKTPYITKKDYEQLMSASGEVKVYFYSDTKVNYLYWVNDIIVGEESALISDTTLFGKTTVVYELEPSQALLTVKNG